MSAASEFEPAARQDYGPTTSNENVYNCVLEHKLADGNMSVPTIRTPVLSAVPLPSGEGVPEPDSTNPESISQSTHGDLNKAPEYEKSCDGEMSVETLSGIVRIEEATIDNAGRITYPIMQEGDDSNDNYENTTIIQGPLNAALVQNVTKIPENFTLNVDATVSNITAIQNLSQDAPSASQTLWLPTLLTTSPCDDNKLEDSGSQCGMSQILVANDGYVADACQTGSRRPNLASDNSYNSRSKSKVQILSNVAIPKNSTYPQSFSNSNKEVQSTLYSSPNHVYKLNTNVIQPKNVNNSVLTNKTSKNQSLVGGSSFSTSVVTSNSSAKNLSYNQSFKGKNLNKTLNQVNNGANLNTMVAASSGNTQCHILSRVVSGPNKVSVHSGRKSVNALKNSKNNSSLSSQKQSRAIKIIQQTGSTHKSDKNWPVANVTTYKNIQGAVVDGNVGNAKVIQKVGSPTHKSQQSLALQKVSSKGERLVLQSPCGPVLISTAPLSTSLPKGPHYVQAGPTPNLRYVHTYGYASESNQTPYVSQVSANQQLTAQILQSLSQPKLLLPSGQTVNHTHPQTIEEYKDVKTGNQKRVVFGDPSTLLSADDIAGMEERPNLTEEIRRYSFQNIALVMLDHTYALPQQKQANPGAAPAAAPPPAAPSPPPPAAPASPPPPPPSAPADHPSPAGLVTMTALQLGALYKPQDDDAASVVSSVDGDRGPDGRGGSDTETAPEGEEEGKTRCVCDFTHDDGYMICCDRCGEWQHVDCMGIDRQNIPDSYMCELCLPRPVDRRHARAIQMRKREELSALGASDSDSSSCGRLPGQRRKRLLTVTTYTNTSGAALPQYSAPPPPPAPAPSLSLPKRGPKRPKKTEVVRKGNKKKLTERRVKRKLMVNRMKNNSNLSHQSRWQDYESAVTNHYSPELRAKIMKYSSKLGNSPNMASAITAHLCTTVPHAGGKILIATKDLKENTPIIELRGKYMLSNQHRPQLQNSARLGSQKPGPFVFFYRLPKDNTQICIDTRTYGNEARFARRSCKPNAELQHCIVKGTLHVYLVTIGTIQSNTEITVSHDSDSSKQPCACGNPKHCKVNGLTSMVSRKSMDYTQREKRSRNRVASMSSPLSPPPAPLTPVKETAPLVKVEKKSPMKSPIKSPVKQELLLMSPVKNVPPLNFDQPIKDEKEVKKEEEEEEDKPEIDLMAKEEMKPEIDEPDFGVKTEPVEEKVQEPEPEKEEVPPEVKEPEPEPEPVPIPAVSEEKEKPQLPDNDTSNSDDDMPEKHDNDSKDDYKDDERPATREFTAKSACHDRSSRSSRNTCTNQDSMDDKTDDSQDKLPTSRKDKDKKKMTREERKMEAIMKAFERMEKDQQRKQEVKERQKRRESDPHPNAPDKDDDDDLHCSTKRRRKRKGRARTTSQCNRRRLNSADSDLVTSGDDCPPRTPPRDRRMSQHGNTDTSNEDLGLSSACLLVEAAVGSVESAFKLPKTKKTMATEWIGRSPERTPSPYRSPYRSSLVSATSLESLVRVASTMIGDLSGGHSEVEGDTSPPRTPSRDRSRPPKKSKRITRSTPPQAEVAEVTPSALPQHSAKKRWLRQAISEESDSPNAESPPNEMVTPLKKRRLARESLSCEQNTVPCTDETSPANEAARACSVRNVMSELYARGRTRSDSGPDEHETDARPPDRDDIRRIIGVPLPTHPPVVTKLEDIRTLNNNVPSAALSPAAPSADTSGNSSPQPDDMDDIQKKIHSFHTENIQILRSRNKKPPKEKRKKVNLNFDLNMVDDQISVQLRTESEVNGDAHEEIGADGKIRYVTAENIPLPAVETIPLPEQPLPKTRLELVPVTEEIPLPSEESIPLPAPDQIPLPLTAPPVAQPVAPAAAPVAAAADPAASAVPFAAKFSSTGLFSGIFSNMTQPFNLDSQINENVPNMQIIKSAIDRTTSLDNSIFDKDSITPVDELKSVQEILTRVNNMDSNNSVLLSGVLSSSEQASKGGASASPAKTPLKAYCARTNDPRLHPPPADKPKPVRRKLSISEYRKRHKGPPSETEGGAEGAWSPGSGAGSLSPLPLDAAAAAAVDDLEQRLHRALNTTNTPKGMFDAQPTASERQRENISSRLRREFGLALPDDEPPAADAADGARCER